MQYADENAQIASRLREAAALLQSQGDNPFRAGAYRRAADTIAREHGPVRELFEARGRADAEPDIGIELARAPHTVLAAPDAATLLDVDREYREKAAAGELQKIAPKRFNPRGEAWLPVLHARRGDWHFTALYSNTARAHDLGCTRDWVVLYYYDGEHVESQCTVVTETHGPLAGSRAVRGREAECRLHYEARVLPAHSRSH